MMGWDDAIIAALTAIAEGSATAEAATSAASIAAAAAPGVAAGAGGLGAGLGALSAGVTAAPEVAAGAGGLGAGLGSISSAAPSLASTGGITGSIVPASADLTSLAPADVSASIPSAPSTLDTVSPYDQFSHESVTPNSLPQTANGASQLMQSAPNISDNASNSKSLLQKWGEMSLKDQVQTGLLGGSAALMGLSALTKKSDPKKVHPKPYNRQFDPSMGIYPSMSGQGLGFAKGGIAALDPGTDAFTAKKISTIRQHYRSKADAVADLDNPNSAIVRAGIYNSDDPLLNQAFGYTALQGKPKVDGPQYMAGGGMAGDGMSDSIPAMINNQQPARLAANEYVVPADVVSHLGNGSSDAGAQQMNSMVARIRKARTGTVKQAPKINPKQFIPR